MALKLFGALLLFACGAAYSYFTARSAAAELAEAVKALEVFAGLKSEIGQYRTRLDVFFLSKGIRGGLEGYLDSLSDGLSAELSDARRLGRGYGEEDMRICDRVVSCLEARVKRLEARLGEVKAISRAKGLGLSAIAVILFI